MQLTIKRDLHMCFSCNKHHGFGELTCNTCDIHVVINRWWFIYRACCQRKKKKVADERHKKKTSLLCSLYIWCTNNLGSLYNSSDCFIAVILSTTNNSCCISTMHSTFQGKKWLTVWDTYVRADNVLQLTIFTRCYYSNCFPALLFLFLLFHFKCCHSFFTWLKTPNSQFCQMFFYRALYRSLVCIAYVSQAPHVSVKAVKRGILKTNLFKVFCNSSETCCSTCNIVS